MPPLSGSDWPNLKWLRHLLKKYIVQWVSWIPTVYLKAAKLPRNDALPRSLHHRLSSPPPADDLLSYILHQIVGGGATHPRGMVYSGQLTVGRLDIQSGQIR